MTAGVTGTVGTSAAGFGRKVFESSAATTIPTTSVAKQAHSATRGDVFILAIPGFAHDDVRCAHTRFGILRRGSYQQDRPSVACWR
jgi:hypothetical protein